MADSSELIYEALWTIEFISNLGHVGAGVAIFEKGRVFGGDSQYYYIGSSRIENGTVHAEITVTHYAGPRSSIFGPLNNFRLKLEGKPNKPVMELEGSLVDAPTMQMRVRITWRADLPSARAS